MGKTAAKLKTAVGDHFTLGATRAGKAVNFAVSVPGADRCTLVLSFGGGEYETVLDDAYRFGSVFAVRVFDLPKEFTYRYKALGREFTDPYARSLKGRTAFGEPVEKTFGAILNDTFDWKGEKRPVHAIEELVIYKLHVRGFTMDESSGVRHKGTYLGVTEKFPYLKKLGINAIMLMPCVEFDECMNDEAMTVPVYTKELMDKGSFHREEKPAKPARVNYWGYGAKADYFAVKAAYASDPGNAEKEFKNLVKNMHKAGIEVFMELSFTGNVNALFVTDVLRYWVTEYHIDGFRFIGMPVPDICISSDPYLADTKLFAEYWDEERAYGDGAIPRTKHLAVIDESFEYTARRFLKGDEGMANGFAECHRRNNKRSAAVNMIADSNGFTLCDLYSYDVKHNETNGENNRDGHEINYSWNCGREGATTSRKILQTRLVMIKNALMALFTAQGIPMILAGDEFLNSQQGNNNAYCRDDSCGWVNWNNRGTAKELMLFTKSLIGLRNAHKVFRNPEQLRLMDYVSYGCPDLSYHGLRAWGPDFSYHSRNLGMLFNGSYAPARNGEPDDDFYVIFNMDFFEHDFDLPLVNKSGKWEIVISSNPQKTGGEGTALDRKCTVPARCTLILKEI
jgi:glycogen operon protein